MTEILSIFKLTKLYFIKFIWTYYGNQNITSKKTVCQSVSLAKRSLKLEARSFQSSEGLQIYCNNGQILEENYSCTFFSHMTQLNWTNFSLPPWQLANPSRYTQDSRLKWMSVFTKDLCKFNGPVPNTAGGKAW